MQAFASSREAIAWRLSFGGARKTTDKSPQGQINHKAGQRGQSRPHGPEACPHGCRKYICRFEVRAGAEYGAARDQGPVGGVCHRFSEMAYALSHTEFRVMSCFFFVYTEEGREARFPRCHQVD